MRYDRGDSAFLAPDDPSPSVWQRFQSAFSDSGPDVFADRLHPFKLVTWAMDQREGISAGLGESANHAAGAAVERSAIYALREAALELPFFRWLKERPRVFSELLRGTLDEVAEESVAPLDPAYGVVERSWWRHLAEAEQIQYGVRPFRTDPYVFVGFRLGEGENLRLLGHVRYYYRNWQDPKLEFAVSLPLPHGFAIDAGTSYEFNAVDHERKFVVKLFKQFKSGGIVHVGVESKQRPVMLAGIAFPW